MSLFSWIRPGVPSGTREIDHTLHRERGRCRNRHSTRSLGTAYESAGSWVRAASPPLELAACETLASLVLSLAGSPAAVCQRTSSVRSAITYRRAKLFEWVCARIYMRRTMCTVPSYLPSFINERAGRRSLERLGGQHGTRGGAASNARRKQQRRTQAPMPLGVSA